MKKYDFYILSNKKWNSFINVANNFIKRISEHKSKEIKGFIQKYEIDKLVYYEYSNSIEDSIIREKELKKWKREWRDLYYSLFE